PSTYSLSLHDALPIFEMSEQIGRRDILAGAAYHRETHLFAQSGVFHRHRSRPLHGWMLRRQLLDLRRMDVVAAANDDVLAVAGEDRKSTRLNSSHVAI